MIFISYSQKDEAPFTSLCLALDAANLPYWKQKLKAGASLKDQLREAISKCDVCIFIATRSSVTSQWCLNEIGAFWGAEKRIVLFSANPDIENELPPLFKGDYWTCDAREVISQVREELAQVEESRNQNHVAEEDRAAPKGGANIVCLNAKPTVLVTRDWVFYDLRDHEQLRDHALNAAVVEFENKPVPGRRVEALDAVEAQISFYDSNGRERERVESGAWVGNGLRVAPFEVGRRKRLVIACGRHKEQGLELWAVQCNSESNWSYEQAYLKLNDEWLRVYVRLIAHGEIVKEEYFELEVISSGDQLDWLTIKKLAD